MNCCSIDDPQPDILIGPGDTLPLIEYTLRNPNNADGSPGTALALSGCTVTFTYQTKAQLETPVTRAVTVIGVDGTGTQGLVRIDLLTAGAIPGTNTDYDARFLVVYPDTHTLRIPNSDTMLWMRVSRDFAPPPA